MSTIHVRQLADKTWEYSHSPADNNYLSLVCSKGATLVQVRHCFKCDDNVVDVTERSEFTLTDKQYTLLLDVFHELSMVFHTAPEKVKAAYFKRLYAK